MISALAKFVARLRCDRGSGRGISSSHAARPKESAYTTPIGGHEIVSLADGSQIELNTDTVVRTDVSPDHRFASIEKGEAYFQIAHDAKHPFVVAAGNRRITVLGTKFFVRQSADRLEVGLIDGRIWFDANNRELQPQAMLLAPGDIAIATPTSVFLKRASEQQLTSELGWRKGVLIFDNTALASAAAEFNRYNTPPHRDRRQVNRPAQSRRHISKTGPERVRGCRPGSFQSSRRTARRPDRDSNAEGYCLEPQRGK